MSDYLPNDILKEILARLPVRTLLQFRCVCKSWCSLITSHDFVTFYHNLTTHSNNINNPHLLLIRHHSEFEYEEAFSLYLDNESLTDYHLNIQNPRIVQSCPFLVLGSCNGLVCLTEWIFEGIIYVWNPSINKVVVLPEPRITCRSHALFYCVLGFGFDSITNDYQVVRIAYVSGDPELDIYSLKEGCWRRISVSGTIPWIPFESSHAFLNGTIHWISGEENSYPFIVSFDLGSKVFSRLELPRSLRYEGVARLSLGVFQDTLFVFYNNDFGREVLGTIIGLKRNGDVLVTNMKGLMSVDTKTLKVKYLGMRGIGVNTYTESLVLMDKVNGGEDSLHYYRH